MKTVDSLCGYCRSVLFHSVRHLFSNLNDSMTLWLMSACIPKQNVSQFCVFLCS